MIGDSSEPMTTLFVKLAVETGGGSEDVEQSDDSEDFRNLPQSTLS